MKRFFLLFSLVIMCVCVAMAQAPEKMTYQAVVRNSANSLVANQNVTVRLSILLGSAQGAPVYVENHTAATNDNGLMTVEIGGGAPTTGVFANIDWANGPYYLKSEIDPTGGINYSIESVQQLMSVPYALYAKEAGNGFSGDYNDLTNKPTFTESQILSISNDTIYLTGGSFVKLPAGFDGDYNSLTNRPNLFSGAYNDLTGKPNLAPVATSGEYNDLTGKPNLAPVATSGNYNDLTNKPTLFDGNYNSLSNRPILFSGNYNDLTNKPNLFDGDYNSLTNRPNLAPVAISGNYNDLLNKPVLFDGNYNSLTNRPNLAPVATSGNYSDLTNKPNLATVATSGSYNDLSNRPAIPAEQVNADWNATSGKAQIINKPNLAPVATSGSYNDITGKPNLAPVATSGNYNDLTNRPQIPTVPTNVSAFTNDAGYITMDSIPTIPTIPTNVSAFQNDAGYITQAAVPTNVSQLQNDAGYLTSFTEQQILSISNDTIYLTGGSFVKLPAGFDGDYNSLTNKPTIPIVPTDVSAFTNDAGYITQAAVPTNVSQLQNDAGYLTSFTEQQILSISNDTIYLTGGSFVKLPAGFDGDYNSLTNKPTIPLVPTNVSAFTNDAGYITQAAVPTNVSQLQNDVGYLTSFTESQILTISNDTIYLTGGSYVKLPAGFDGDYNSLTNKPNLAPVATTGSYNDIVDKPNLAPVATSGNYNDLTNRPQIPQVPTNVSAFTNDAGYITMDSIPTIPTIPTNVSAFQNDAGYLTSFTEQQILTISNDTIYLTGGSYVKLPAGFDGDYNSLTNKPTIPIVPTDVSAFTNDAGYITMDSIPTIPTIPTNVSAFQNDAGYLTSFTEQQILSISNDTIYLTGGSYVKLPAGFDGDYNSLTNKPTIPIVPTDVSAFTNDAGYITMDSIPSIPTIPTNVSAFQNDAGYLTSFTEQQILSISNDTIYLTGGSYVKLPTGFDGDYNSLTNKPTIPIVPTDVSVFNNDAGYITQAAVPTNVSAFQNDAGYITMDSIPSIPTVPTNVSAFQNDAGYITMDSVPSIPTNVSAFANDAGYVTVANVQQAANIPTNVSAFANDAGYLTSFTEQQILSISNDTIYLTGGSFVKLPAGFDGDYNSLTNKPTNVSAFTNDAGYITQSAVPSNVSAFQNDAGYITMGSVPSIPTNVSAFTNDVGYVTANDIPAYQVLSISNDTIYLSNGGYAVLPPGFDGDYNSLTNRPNLFSGSYNDLTDTPTIPTVPTNVSAFTNDAGYLTSFAEQQIMSISNDTIYLTGGSFVKLPAGFDGDYNSLTNKPVLFSGNYNDLTGKPNLAPVATSGSYNDITGKPNLAPVATSGEYNDLTGKPNLAPVATSGNYNDLSNTPTIPAEQVNADWNAISGVEEILNKPTNVSAFNNDAGYLTSDSLANLNNQLDSLQQALNNLQQMVENDHFICGTSTVTDHEGNVYHTVKIGDQCWTKENLRTTTSPTTGTYLIPAAGTGYTYTGKQARWYNNDSTTYAPLNYGLLYNWNAAVDTFNTTYGETSVNDSSGNAVHVTFNGYRRGICPEGWHLPSYEEWTALTNYVSGRSEYLCDSNTNYIAKALADSIGWCRRTEQCAVGNDQSANNATGFSAVPAGASFGYASDYAHFWSSSQIAGNLYNAFGRSLWSNYASVIVSNNNKKYGFSVRCLRDNISISEQIDAQRHILDSLANLNSQLDSLQHVLENLQQNMPFSCGASTVSDHEGNVYHTVKIGDQCWTRENLRTTTSPTTGTRLIPAADTGYTYTGKQAFWYNNDSVTYAPMNYGLLYNWNAAVDTFNTAYGETSLNQDYNNAVSVTFDGHRRGICPEGWHLPSDAEWTALTNYVSGQSEYLCDSNTNYIAKALADNTGWYPHSNTCAVGNDQSANNATGFSAVPAGGCYGSSFFYAGTLATFWSSSHYEYYARGASDRFLYCFFGFVQRDDSFGYHKANGYSVRCLRDNPSIGEQIDAQQHILDSLAPVAFTGDYNDLSNAPTIPTNVSAFSNDAGYVTQTQLNNANYITNTGSSCGNSLDLCSLLRRLDSLENRLQNMPASNNTSAYGVPLNDTCPQRMVMINGSRNACYHGSSQNNVFFTVLVDGSAVYDATYTWYVDGQLISHHDGFLNYYAGRWDPTHNNPHIFTSKVTMADGCSYLSGPFEVNVYDLPDVIITGNDSVVCEGENVTLRAGLRTPGNPMITYQWYENTVSGNNALPGRTHEDETFRPALGTTDYIVLVTHLMEDYGCLSLDTFRVEVSSCEGNGGNTSAVIDSKSCPGTPTVTDHEGNVYATVQIGNQCWMRDNLRTTTSPSTGTYLIPAAGTSYTYTGKQAFWYNNDSTTYAPMNYGLLYNWNAAVDTFNTEYVETSVDTSFYNAVSVSFTGNRRGICPAGWHLPSGAEWTTLANYLSSQSQYVCGDDNDNIGKALTSAGGWRNSTNTCAVGNNQSANNATGFEALPVSYCSGSIYHYLGNFAYFWNATQVNSSNAIARELCYANAFFYGYLCSKSNGLSVRCLRDN